MAKDALREAFSRVKNDIEMLHARMRVLDARQQEVETMTKQNLVALLKEQELAIRDLRRQAEKQESMITRLRKEISSKTTKIHSA